MTNGHLFSHVPCGETQVQAFGDLLAGCVGDLALWEVGPWRGDFMFCWEWPTNHPLSVFNQAGFEGMGSVQVPMLDGCWVLILL